MWERLCNELRQSQVLSLGELSKRPRVLPSMSCSLAAHKAQKLTEALCDRKVRYCRVSRNCQGKGSRFYPFNTDSDLVLVLSLWPLAKASDHTKASHCLP